MSGAIWRAMRSMRTLSGSTPDGFPPSMSLLLPMIPTRNDRQIIYGTFPVINIPPRVKVFAGVLALLGPVWALRADPPAPIPTSEILIKTENFDIDPGWEAFDNKVKKEALT